MFEPKPRIYTELQAQLTLDDSDRAALKRDRGFTDTNIDILGFKTAKPENAPIIQALIETYGLGDCLGSSLCDIHGNPAWQFVNPAKAEHAILIPYLESDGKTVYLYKCHKTGTLTNALVTPYCEFIFNNAVGKQVILCESEFKAAALWQLGYKALGLGGISTFSSKHIDNLVNAIHKATPEQIIIMFDNEIQDDPRLKSYKPDYRGRYANIIWSYIMARRLDKLMNSSDVENAKPVDIRIATLPMDWDQNGTGKVDIDYALSLGRGRQHFDKVIKDSMEAEIYKEHTAIPEVHKSYVLRAMAKAIKSDFLSISNNCYWTKVKKQVRNATLLIDKKLSNFIIDVKGSLNKEGEISREFMLRSEFREKSSLFTMKGSDMSSFSKFREKCLGRGDFLWKGNDDDWNLVIEDLFYETDVNIIQILKMVGRHEERKFWAFDNIIIDDDGKEHYPTDDKVTFKLAEDHFRIEPISDAPLPKLSTKPIEMVEIFKKFIEAWGPEGAMGYGWMIANIFSNYVFDKYQLFPFLLLFGEKGSGKSALSDSLMALAGFPASIPAMNISETTQVAIARKLAFYHSMPIRLDELRQGEAKITQKTSALRSFYNRQGASKGLREGYGVREIVIKGTAMIIGEQRVEDPALLSRCLTLQLNPRAKTQKSYEAMQWLYEHAKELSYVWYTFIKDYKKTAAAFMESVEATRISLAKLSDTMSDTRTQVHFAMIMAALGLNQQHDTIIEMQRKLLAMFTRTSKDLDEKSALNIFFEEIEVMANLTEVPSGLVSLATENPEIGIVAFSELYEVWSKFKQQRGANSTKLDKNTLINYLKLQPYVLQIGIQRRVKVGDEAETKRLRCVEIDLSHRQLPSVIASVFNLLEARATID